ncbi:DUF6817 domain-containing protein [Streptomyces aureus]|uniref:DUF6817 domain-containing protein n=1 Tax=Streptomyces aureus TaxID=193461 RepID=UPI0036C8BEF6
MTEHPNATSPSADRSGVHGLLRSRDAAVLAHPGGTLLEHLIRVERRLADWGAPREVQVAGLCHAAYGTDGFGVSLLGLEERPLLTARIGARAEALVYLYGSCDRAATYPRLREDRRPLFKNRFTGTDHDPAVDDLRAFLEITAANELDVFEHNDELALRYAAGLRSVLEPVRHLLSPGAWESVRRGTDGHAATA